MSTPFQLVALASLSLAALSAVPDPASPVSDAVRAAAGRAGSNFIAAAEDMPADKYGFKPTPAQMSFGEVITHMAAGNDALCSSIGGVPVPKRSAVDGGATKEKLVARLRETVQFCRTALAKVDDSRLGKRCRTSASGRSPGRRRWWRPPRSGRGITASSRSTFGSTARCRDCETPAGVGSLGVRCNTWSLFRSRASACRASSTIGRSSGSHARDSSMKLV